MTVVMAFNILLTIFLIFLNGFFVAAEFAIVKVRASQLEVKVQEGNPLAALAKTIVSNLDGYLAATQLGITLASLGLGWIGEPVVATILIGIMHSLGFDLDEELAHNIALPIAFTLITILHIVFGELAPKSVAIQRSEATTLFIAYPLQIFYVVFRPFIWLLNGIATAVLKTMGILPEHGSEIHSSEELQYLVQQGKEGGTVKASDYEIITNAFTFSDRIVRQVMIPRLQVLAIDVETFDVTALEHIIGEGHSRIPCYEDDLDSIIGVVYLKDILLKMRGNEPINLRELIRPMMFVPITKRIGALLKEFQARHQQMAAVVNEYGGIDGIVTMEDILEELVGEIQDETDHEIPIVTRNEDTSYTVLATSPLEDVNEYLPRPIPENNEYETLAGYLIHKFGSFPSVKDKIIADDYEFTVMKKSQRSIILVQVLDLKNSP